MPNHDKYVPKFPWRFVLCARLLLERNQALVLTKRRSFGTDAPRDCLQIVDLFSGRVLASDIDPVALAREVGVAVPARERRLKPARKSQAAGR